MRVIKQRQDLRTPLEWEEWARAKSTNEPRDLTEEETDEMELGSSIEFEPGNLKKAKIFTNKENGIHLNSVLPPNYIGKP